MSDYVPKKSADHERIDMRDPYYRPRHVGLEAAAKFLAEERNVPTTIHFLKRRAESGQLTCTLISGKRYFSDHDLDQMLLSLRHGVSA